MNETERKQHKQQGAVYSVPVSEDAITTQLRLTQRGALKTMKKNVGELQQQRQQHVTLVYNLPLQTAPISDIAN